MQCISVNVLKMKEQSEARLLSERGDGGGEEPGAQADTAPPDEGRCGHLLLRLGEYAPGRQAHVRDALRRAVLLHDRARAGVVDRCPGRHPRHRRRHRRRPPEPPRGREPPREPDAERGPRQGAHDQVAHAHDAAAGVLTRKLPLRNHHAGIDYKRVRRTNRPLC